MDPLALLALINGALAVIQRASEAGAALAGGNEPTADQHTAIEQLQKIVKADFDDATGHPPANP